MITLEWNDAYASALAILAVSGIHYFSGNEPITASGMLVYCTGFLIVGIIENVFSKKSE